MENVTFCRSRFGGGKGAARRAGRRRSCSPLVGLTGWETALFRTSFSGGMRQAVWRSPAAPGPRGPPAPGWLMDEAVSGRLTRSRADRAERRSCCRSGNRPGTTIVFVTHSIYEAGLPRPETSLLLAARAPAGWRELVPVTLADAQ